MVQINSAKIDTRYFYHTNYKNSGIILIFRNVLSLTHITSIGFELSSQEGEIFKPLVNSPIYIIRNHE